MNISPINNSQNFYGKPIPMNFVPKYFDVVLHDGSIAKVRLRHDGNKLNSMECYTFNKNGEYIGGKAQGENPYLSLVDITNFLKDIQNATGENVFKKFAEAIFK